MSMVADESDDVVALRRRLAESEARLRTIIDRNADGMVIVDDEGVVRFANPAAAALFAKKPEDLVGGTFGFPLVTRELTELDLVGEGAHQAVAEMRVAEIVWEDRAAYLASLRDVTERLRAEELIRRKEEQLQHALRLTAVGRVAAAMAHEMNDVLMGVAGCSRLALRGIDAESPARGMIEAISKAADEGTLVVRHLALVAANRSAQPRALDLNAVVEGLTPLVRRLVGRAFELVVDLGPALWQPFADEARVEQILINLVMAARDHMPEGGALRVCTRNVTLGPAEEPFRDPIEADEYVLLEVEGLADGVDHHAELDRRPPRFEPLFTADDGSGFGLAVVRSFIEEGGGQLKLHGDARYLVYLPRAHRAAAYVPPPPVLPRKGGETVLVVDDEPLIRTALRGALELAGYRVLDADSAADAVNIARQFVEPIHALVTDVRLPGRSGLELGRQLSAERPELRVVYMADWGDRTGVRERVLDAALLEKPCAPDVVLHALDGLLAQRAPASPLPPEPSRPTGAMVLLVEDEDVTRTALARLLGYRGHRVLAAKTAEEALAWARGHGPIDVLLTDLALPASTAHGDELAREIVAMSPHTRVIFVSGFPREMAAARYHLPEGAEYMEKPLELDVLERRIEELWRDR